MIDNPARFENLSPLFGMTQEETDECTLRRIGDGEGDDFDRAPLEAADYIQQLADTILQEYGKLPDRRVIPPSDRRQSSTGAFVVAHGWPLPSKKCPVHQRTWGRSPSPVR